MIIFNGALKLRYGYTAVKVLAVEKKGKVFVTVDEYEGTSKHEFKNSKEFFTWLADLEYA